VVQKFNVNPFLLTLFESAGVDCVGIRLQQVPRSPRDDEVVAREGLKRSAQRRHVDLDRVGGRPGRFLVPEQIDEPLGGDYLACVEEQDRQERTLLRGPEVGRGPIG